MSRPVIEHLRGGVLSLSGPDLEALLRAVLARNVRFRFRARGSSMHPFIRNGDRVTVSPATDTYLQPGDVVAFIDNGAGRLVVHRIVAASRESFLIQGDNNPAPDGWIPSVNVLGRVTLVEGDGKHGPTGLGPERHLIAWLVRKNLLRGFVHYGGRFLRPFLKGYAE
jgi:signal peptidase I